jgi:signal transduction histidine kinase/CheY-like chemotaxis protein
VEVQEHNLKMLHIEDNPADAELIKVALRRGGFNCDVLRVETRDACQSALREQNFDLIIADYALPAFDGISALAIAHQLQPDTPFIFVSGTLGEELAIETLKSGAHDYVLKHSLNRLAPAVRRAMRETSEREKARRAENALLSSERRFRFLAEVSQVLASSLDYHANLQNVARLSVPQLADWCAIYIIEDDESIQPIAISHIDPQKVEYAKEVLWRYPVDPGTLQGWPSVMQSGSPLLVPSVSVEILRSIARDEQHFQVLLQMGMSSYLCVPLKAREQILGTISLVRIDRSPAYTQNDQQLAVDLARRVSVSIENAKLYHEAQEAIRARDEFLSIASHELKTPLTTLQLEVQMLLRLSRKGSGVVPMPVGAGAESSRGGAFEVGRGSMGKPAPSFTPEFIATKLEVLEHQTKKLSKLINNLLDVSRIAAGRLEIRLEEVDVARVVRDVITRFGPQFSLAGSILTLKADSPIIAKLDRLRIEQVITNLVSNTLKYGRGKPVEVLVEEFDHKCRIVVSDHGIGIAPEHKTRIFERFERAAASRNYGGLGLGLYIVKQIVDGLCGTVYVESNLGAGSTFTVELPLDLDEKVVAEKSRSLQC